MQCTDGILTVGARESNAFMAQPVQIGRVDIWIPERVDGVRALLITCQPENIWKMGHFHAAFLWVLEILYFYTL